MWLSTSKGLVSFDGMQFRLTPITGGDGMDGKVINSLTRRQDGGLWFGLHYGSFGYFHGGQFHSIQREEWGGSLVTVRVVQPASDGSLLVGGSGLGGRLRKSGEFVPLLPTPDADIFALFEDSQNRIWMGTAGDGLFYWQHGRLQTFPDPTLKDSVISAVTVDQQGNIWVGTGNGLHCYDANFESIPVTGIETAQPKALLVDRHGVLWVGSGSGGLIRHKNGVFSTLQQSDGLASNRILSLAESDDGSLWIGTEDGISQLLDVKFPSFTTAQGLVSNSTLAVAASPQGGLWAGTPNGASYFHQGRFENFGFNGGDGFHSRWIKRIFAAGNGDVYFIGARQNVDRFRDGRVVKTWNNDVWPRAVAEDAHGILVALGSDLMRLEDDELVPFRLADGSPVSLLWIRDMLVARDDSIWLAAIEGVFRIKDGIIRNLCHANNVFETSFHSLHQAADGAVWAAQITGIARFKDDLMSSINHEQGLHENFVYAMVEDKLGNFWLDSNRGIFRISSSELNAVADGTAPQLHCTVYEGEGSVKTTDKAQEDYFGCLTADGRVWFPSSKGVIMIDPASVSYDSAPPAVSIERVRVNGREFSPQDVPELKPGAGNLEFHYVALDFSEPESIRYRYRLDGYESEWVEAGGRRSAFYTNLKPGQYEFQVQASSVDGVWNTTGTRYSLVLPHRFHETVFFRATSALALIGLGAFIWHSQNLRRSKARLQQEQMMLESKVRERTSELTAEIEERKRMQLEVEHIHKQLLELSRQAGMAEVATGVLHNVGNVLNSVNVSATLVRETLRNSKIKSLGRVATLLRDHDDTAEHMGSYLSTDPKGRMVPQFIIQLADQLAAEHGMLLAENQQLAKNVDHIKEVVAMQQNHATVSGITETVQISDLLDDALKIYSASFMRYGIEVVRDYAELSPVTLDKHKVMQILVNLITNAKHALKDSGRSDGRITVAIRTQGKDRYQIAVTDNGVGIAPETITRIFSHGFTTRANGHGFGLHSGANAAREMGGSLTVASPGLGLGATFVLDLPIAQQVAPDTPKAAP